MCSSKGTLRFSGCTVLAQVVAFVALFAGVAETQAQSNIDPDHKFAWGENIGWTNWRDANSCDAGVVIGETYLSGYIWAENVGWINVGDGSPADGVHYANSDGLDFGVNVDAEGNLYGFAWGENIGWINFDGGGLASPPQPARIDACGRFRGYVWAENAGWINLGNTVPILATDSLHLGDVDADGDVDLQDFLAFQVCYTGPGGVLDPGCECHDFDGDDDVDLQDFLSFQVYYTGPASKDRSVRSLE